MPRHSNDIAREQRPLAFIAASLLALLVLTVWAPPVLAQAEKNAVPDAVTPVEEFSKQVEDLKKTFTDLSKKIEDSAKSIGEQSDAEAARKEIEELRAIVGTLLGAVSDNGTVSQLGVKALEHAREKVKTLEHETRYTREEQQFLLGEWRKLIDETERATDDLGSARKEFAQLLRLLQTRQDFIDELLQIRRATEAANAIHQLANDIRAASDALKNLIRAIKPPGV